LNEIRKAFNAQDIDDNILGILLFPPALTNSVRHTDIFSMRLEKRWWMRLDSVENVRWNRLGKGQGYE
jgi:hypothetical protein